MWSGLEHSRIAFTFLPTRSSDSDTARRFGHGLRHAGRDVGVRADQQLDVLEQPRADRSVRPVDGAIVATLVLGSRMCSNRPRWVAFTNRLFAQQVASMFRRGCTTSQQRRGLVGARRHGPRGELVAPSRRRHATELRHAVARLHAEGAALGLLRDDQIVVVRHRHRQCRSGHRCGERERRRACDPNRRAVICNDANVADRRRIAAGIDNYQRAAVLQH